MFDYRVALLAGLAIVVALGIAGLFPVAVVAAALMIPLVTVVYFYDVDVYEREPALVTAFTLIWGAAAGIGFGLLANAATPSEIGVAQTHEANALLTVVGLPLLALALAILGPVLVLFPYRRFNDVLDGAAFGAASAAALAGAAACVYGIHLLGDGMSPGGEVLPWVIRLTSSAIALPVVSLAATGAATGAIWLRFRASAAERGALGPLGSPPVAIGLAGLLLVAAAAGQHWLPVGVWLATLVVIGVAALVWLRLVLRAGLLGEASEREIGPAIRCTNCGEQTRQHTFCAVCGVALKALPKGPSEEGGGRVPGESRLSRRWRLLGLMVAFGSLLAATAVIVDAAAPPGLTPACPTGPLQCGNPPSLPLPVGSEVSWRSPELGFGLGYAVNQWTVEQQDSTGIQLSSSAGPLQIVVRGSSAPGETAEQLVADRVSSIGTRLLGLTLDPDPADAIDNPLVGHRPGAGDAYVGAVDTPQGVQDQLFVVVLAAIHRGVGVVVTIVTDESDPNARARLYSLADPVINSVDWDGGP
ncbi:MAG: hypothetical protein QOI10_16 [Solirubrobacterales bacterium]|jgi:hypothetical protein|nr:hypothetical protein [Solirubrobacterales bacterium]